MPYLVRIETETFYAGLPGESPAHCLGIAVAKYLEEARHDAAQLFGWLHGRVSSLGPTATRALASPLAVVGPRGLEPRTCGLRVWSEWAGQSARTPLELRVRVSLIPIVSQRFPLFHGDETGAKDALCDVISTAHALGPG
jgi:hypothetical protein